MNRIRKDVASLGAGWSDELLWYARAVGALQTEPASSRTSWRYLGAIHGFEEQLWIDLAIIAAGDPLPPEAEWHERMWNQCQHQGWWFLPWHRGYLWSFEAIVAAKVAELGGPTDWALPYWNYFDTSNPAARDIPAPFLEPELPDGGRNPLADVPRGGAGTLGPVPWFPQDISLDAMGVRFFTSTSSGRGFGGGQTVFNQFGGKSGALELDPHNAVHVMLGGPDGFMSDPDLAGLDPIFWLHHCNIDRLWAAWLATTGHIQENSASWSNGPAPRRFEVPAADGSLRVFTPAETLPGGALAPAYDDLVAGSGSGALPAGADEEPGAMAASLSSDPPPDATLVGANAGAITVGEAPVATVIELDPSEAEVAAAGDEQRILLNLDQVRGTTPSGVLSITIALKGPDGAAPAADHIVKTVALFGLANASREDRGHGANGISVSVDVTDLLKALGQEAGAPLERFEVRLSQPATGRTAPISVERVSLYRQPDE